MKRDLKDAFRHIPVASSDHWLLGFFCDSRYWMERYLPLGLYTSPFVFDLFAKALHWILAGVLMWTRVLHYLDDFFAILSSNDDPHAYAAQFDQVCSDLGLSVNHTKDVMGNIAHFLGIEFDSIRMRARLPPDKLARARNSVENLINQATISHREPESAVGFLSFAAKVVVLGRAFLRRVFDALRRPIAIHRITYEINADLLWWQSFLKDWMASNYYVTSPVDLDGTSGPMLRAHMGWEASYSNIQIKWSKRPSTSAQQRANVARISSPKR